MWYNFHMKSLKPINTSVYDFPTLIQKGCVYVDKTAQIYEIAKPSADDIKCKVVIGG